MGAKYMAKRQRAWAAAQSSKRYRRHPRGGAESGVQLDQGHHQALVAVQLSGNKRCGTAANLAGLRANVQFRVARSRIGVEPGEGIAALLWIGPDPQHLSRTAHRFGAPVPYERKERLVCEHERLCIAALDCDCGGIRQEYPRELLLGGPKRFLQPLVVRFVPNDLYEAVDYPNLIAYAVQNATCPKAASIAADVPAFILGAALCGGDRQFAFVFPERLILRREDHTGVLANRFPGRVLENPFGPAAPGGDHRLRAHCED